MTPDQEGDRAQADMGIALAWARSRYRNPTHGIAEQNAARAVLTLDLVVRSLVSFHEMSMTATPCLDPSHARVTEENPIHVAMPGGKFVCCENILEGIVELLNRHVPTDAELN
jgi:hypothetical protein